MKDAMIDEYKLEKCSLPHAMQKIKPKETGSKETHPKETDLKR
jgi:hypothetical protein